MRKLVLAAAAAAAFALPAQAATIVAFAPGGPTGDPGAFAGETVKFDFDDEAGGAELTGLSGSYSVFNTPSPTTNSAPPAGSPNGNFYLSVANPAVSGVAELDLGGSYKTVSFYWGSIDKYNFVTVHESNGSSTTFGPDELTTFLGGEPNWGNQTVSGANIRFQFKAANGSGITGLEFEADGFAFELDDVAVGAAVPEPATWAMMVGGFGLLGFAARRRRQDRSVLA